MKVLLVASEISPFLQTCSIGTDVNSIIKVNHDKNVELRPMSASFGVISAEKHHMYDVYRLSGINIPVGKENISLIGRVAPIKKLKTHVYFAYNEDMFERRGVFQDQEGTWYKDNYTRLEFFCRSILKIAKELGWGPDIIHCHGWFSSLIPLFLKTIYKNTPIFKKTKCIYTFYPEPFNPNFQEDIFQNTKIKDLKPEHIEALGKGDFHGLINLAASCSDICTRNFKEDKDYTKAWLEKHNVQYIPSDENLATNYLTLYKQLLTT